MYNVNANASTINAFATSFQALATIGMLAVTYFLWRSAKASASYAERQTNIMDKQMLIEKYRRLRDEMDNLVAPLYIQAYSYDNEYQGIFALYYLSNYIDRESGKLSVETEFWNKIQMNLHLSQSGKLSEYVQRYFDLNLERIHIGKEGRGGFEQYEKCSTKRETNFQKIQDNAANLVEAIKERHTQLKAELEEVEKELGIRNHS